MLVPFSQTTGSWRFTSEPSTISNVPSSSSVNLVFISIWETAAIDASASPRKPMVRMVNRSSALRILEVACLSRLIRASVSDIPLPLSIICNSVFPASFKINLTWVESASIEFSISSLTADAGRCTTSPAAIWLAIESGSSWIMSGMK